MKTIIRNLLSVIRRFKMATILNVLGLSVAFAAFMVILMQVSYEHRFDRCHPTADRVFRVNLMESETFSTILPRAFIESILQSSPHIKAGTLLNPFINPIYFTVIKNGEKQGFREAVVTCHPGIVQTFGFPILEGDPSCLKDPDKIIIPASMARKMFGNQSAVGQSLHAEDPIWSKNRSDSVRLDLTVGAVYRDFPNNTQLKNVIYTAIDENYAKTNFDASNYICYLLLDDAASAENVANTFNQNFDFKNIGQSDERIKLIPLTDIYYLNEDQTNATVRSGNTEITRLLMGIAILILIIAAINYMNFSTALTPLRMKSLNIQKVLGSSDKMLRFSLLAEATIICFISWLIAVLIVAAMSESKILSFVDADLNPLHNGWIVLLSGGLALLTGIIAGLYPSRYMTSFSPAFVLKGSFGLSLSGRRLRTALIGFQFVVSIALIIAAGFVQLQNRYMRTYSLGFDKDQIAVVELNNEIVQNHQETYVNNLESFPGIEDVAFSSQKIAAQDVYSTNGGKYKDKDFSYFLLYVSWNFMSTMGIPIEEGRDFLESDMRSEKPIFIFNDYAKKSLEMDLGPFNYWQSNIGDIVGFSKDIMITSLRQANNNLCFMPTNKIALPVSYIRLRAGTDVHAAVEQIRKTIAKIDPSYPFDVEFYDTIFDQLYHKEMNLRSLVILFSLLAIILSLVGVFGLVVFDSQYRRKEIGIRKVFGSTTRQILVMFNKTYLKIVVVCFVIAAPVAYFAVTKWLESFAYKTPLYVWVFMISFLVVAFVTFTTVTFQNWRAANANPVESIKSE